MNAQVKPDTFHQELDQLMAEARCEVAEHINSLVVMTALTTLRDQGLSRKELLVRHEDVNEALHAALLLHYTALREVMRRVLNTPDDAIEHLRNTLQQNVALSLAEESE